MFYLTVQILVIMPVAHIRCLALSFSSGSWPQFPANVDSLGGSRDGPSNWVPAMPVGELDGVPGSLHFSLDWVIESEDEFPSARSGDGWAVWTELRRYGDRLRKHTAEKHRTVIGPHRLFGQKLEVSCAKWFGGLVCRLWETVLERKGSGERDKAEEVLGSWG